MGPLTRKNNTTWEKGVLFQVREFDYSKLSDRTWDNETISYLSKIHEYKGKQELFLRQKPIELKLHSSDA